MSQAELISACLKNDKTAKKQLFESYCSKLYFIANRYSKNSTQAEQVLLNGFACVFSNLGQFKSQNSITLDEFIKNEEFVLGFSNL